MSRILEDNKPYEDEDSKELRQSFGKMREEERKKRTQALQNYLMARKNVEVNNPQGKRSPIGSPEWNKYAQELSKHKDPRNEFYKEIDQELIKILKLKRMNVVNSIHNPKGLHDILGVPENEKQNTDAMRIEEFIHDCYEDGTSPQYTAIMTVDLLKSMGYVR